MKLVYVVLVSMIGMLILIGNANAISGEWSSTSQFDSGTKSEPSPTDGNYGVETSTDSGWIDEGEIQLTSRHADLFSYDDLDSETFRWDASVCQSPTVTSQIIDNGFYRASVTRSLSGGRAAIRTQSSYSGILDVRFNFTDSSASDQDEAIELQIINEATDGCYFNYGTADGFVYQIVRDVACGACLRMYLFVVTNGVPVLSGSATQLASMAFWVRVVIDQSTPYHIFYYSLNGGLTWTVDEISTFVFSGNSFVSLTVIDSIGAADAAIFDVDNFLVSIGNPSVPSYRTSGNWTSPNVAINVSVSTPTHVVLSYENVDAENTVDYVRVYVDGTLHQEWTDDIESGSLSVLEITEAWPSGPLFNFSMRIGLKSVGDDSPVLTAAGYILGVQVVLPTTLEAEEWAFIAGIALVLIFLVLGAVTKVPVFLIMAGLVLAFLSFSIEIISSNVSMFLLALFGGIVLMVFGGLASFVGTSDSA